MSEGRAEGLLKTTDLFFRDIMNRELDFAHATCAEGLGEGIVAEDSVCAAGLFGCRAISVLAVFLVGHGLLSVAIRRACLRGRVVGLRGHGNGPRSWGELCPRGQSGERAWDGRRS